MSQTRPTLQQLGALYKTDKADNNTFLPFYESRFKSFRDEPIHILEIGVFFGSSLKMWHEYFPKATVYGLDHFTGHQGNGNVFSGSRQFYDEVNTLKQWPRIRLIECDQSDRKSLEVVRDWLLKQGVRFHFILDDGSHLMKDQQQTLAILWPLLTENGQYYMEDWGSSLDLRYPDVKPDFSNTTLTMMKGFNSNKQIESCYMTQDEQTMLTQQVKHPIFLFDQNSSTTACFEYKAKKPENKQESKQESKE